MEQKILTFSGNNSQLFCRIAIGQISPKLTLLVPETHNAILIKDGQMLQTLSSGRYLISKFVDQKNEQDAKMEVLFMSKTAKLKLLWGTPQKFLMYDPQLDENYKVGMSGDFDVQIGDPRKCYLYLVGANQNLTSDELQQRLTITVVSVLENEIAEYVEQNNLSFNQLSVKKRDISAKVLSKINQRLMTDYGIAVFSFNIANILIDQEDEKNLKSAKQSGKEDVFCSGCGKKLKSTAKFCENCGRKVGDVSVCANCHAENDGNAKFCSNCGKKL